MDIATLTALTSKYAAEVPETVAKTLADVEVIVCRDVQHATRELMAEFDDAEEIPADCKGIFVGESLEADEDDDELHAMPDGVIFLIASNIADEKEAVLVLNHEMGHALGLDENEVSALGLGVEQPMRSQVSSNRPRRREQYATALAPCACDGGGGLGDVFSDIAAPLKSMIDAKTAKLENALKIIIGLSAVAALASIVALRGKR